MNAAREMAVSARMALFAAALSLAGCQTHRNVAFDAANPAVSVTTHGVYFAGDRIEPRRLPEALEEFDVPKTRTIHIHLDEDVKDLTEARFVMGMLGKAGYTRPVLVTKRHAQSMAAGKKKNAVPKEPAKGSPAPMRIRYKRAGE